MSQQFTLEEVAKHNKEGDLWVVIDSKVYDLSKLLNFHPGGRSVLLDEEVAGKDVTETFFSLHLYEVLEKPQYKRFIVGSLAGAKQQYFPRVAGTLSAVPYSEPTWLSKGYFSPYYKESHRALQVRVRKFVDDLVYPEAQLHEANGKPPSQKLIEEAGRLGLIAMRLGPGPHLKGMTLMEGAVKPEEFDYFHELVITQELIRLRARGYADGFGGGTYIGLPPIVNFGKPALRDKVVKDVFAGKTHVALAISEAFAGSDVAGIRCFAKRVEGGWRVTGTKKWITNGTFADYFSVGCRTEKGGYIVLLIQRGPGVETKPIKTTYSIAAGTAYITLDDVFVPEDHLLGEEEKGLVVMLSNFNHERWGMICASISSQRAIVEDCLKWITQRKVFGKPLSNQAVIRSKLAAMISRVESAQAWLENITYQMTHMKYEQQSIYLAGPMGLLKQYATSTAQDTAKDAVQIFGGRGITKSGMGRLIEHYHSTVTYDAVLGGAEDVLGDLGVRQALKRMPKNVRL